MAFDFPANPGLNQVFTPVVDGPSWKWDGTGWVSVPSYAITEAPTDGILYGRKDTAWQPAVDKAVYDVEIPLKAPLASPVFTGDPRAPTPPPGDNDTSIATTAYTTAAIAAASGAGGYVPEAPNDGKNYVRKSLVWNDFSDEMLLKADLASPVFTGDPKAPTPTVGDNDTSIATTAFVTGAIITATASASVKTARPYNHIVNPALQHSQQNGDTQAAGTSYWPADQWFTAVVSTGTLLSCRYLTPTPYGSMYKLILTVSVVDASIAAGEYWCIGTVLEGLNMAEFRWGYADAKQVVLRFGSKHPVAGTFGGVIKNPAGNRNYPFSYTVTAGQVNQEVYRTIVIPGDTTGSWPVAPAAGLYLWFSLMAGTTFQQPAGAWGATSALAPTGQTNGAATYNWNHEYFDIGLYIDPDNTGVAPPWEQPDWTTELARCRRYYADYNNLMAVSFYAPGVSANWNTFFYQTYMRVAPSVAFSYYSNSNTTGMFTAGVYSDGFRAQVTLQAGGAGYSFAFVAVSARM